MTRALRTLLFSTLYPSSVRPLHGIFVETRLRELLKSGQVETRVVAPVPWFPWSGARWGEYGRFAATPQVEQRHGVEVHHPRYLLLPKVGMSSAPLALALGALPTVRRLLNQGFAFDLIDAHYYYPDGVAAALLGRWLGKPVVVTARGSDINLIAQHRVPRALISWAGRHAGASIGVSQALTDRLQALSIAPDRLHKIRNGVDLERFRPLEPDAMRQQLGVTGSPVLLTVGNLHHHKGQWLVLEALALLRATHPTARLVIIGDGPDRASLMARAQALGLTEAVSFAGQVPNTELLRWYSAADVLVLASSREGWPNVLLEAMACGTPVVAAQVGGVPEVVADPVAGALVPQREPAAFAAAVEGLLARGRDRAAVRRYAEGFSWEATSRAQIDLFRGLAPRTTAQHSTAQAREADHA